MRSRSLILSGLGLLLLAVALLWWRRSDRPITGTETATAAGGSAPAVRRVSGAVTNQETSAESTAPLLNTDQKSKKALAATQADPLAHRFSNTPKTSGQLLRDDGAILLENALIETGKPLGFKIPEHLKLTGDPGSYLVQARGPVDQAFLAALTEAGAEPVSFIPNNAWLVRASKEVAARLTTSPATRAVLPWEPIYKLKSELLGLALENQPLPRDAKLNLLIFNGAQAEVLAQLQKLEAVRLAEDRSPFGTVVTVQPGADWVALAQLPGVQLLERAYPRARANDITRVRMGVATNTVTTNTYLGLTGTNVLVGINDWGVDQTHPDLTGRILASSLGGLTDTLGHGTHVGGIIAGSGLMSTTVKNAKGSIMPASDGQFRGMAPGARLFSQYIDFGLNTIADSTLQEATARTNVFISNNSWSYIGNSSYSLAAASFDAAVRDSLPGVPGSQPVLYVFAAGNNGGAQSGVFNNNGDNGLGGDPGSVTSPATAKNVIAVGAIELARDITNIVEKIVGGATNKNAAWKGMTSSGNEVAGFSGRGNVGIGVEGDFGRFKPDVVAPGTFVISTRSSTWDEKAYYNPTNHNYTILRNQLIVSNRLSNYALFLPDNAVGFQIILFPNDDTPDPFPNLPIYVRRDGQPTTTQFDLLRTNFVVVPPDLGGVGSFVGQNWSYSIGNPTSETISVNIFTDVITTNDFGNYFQVLSNLNNSIVSTNFQTTSNFYRYESGTSMAAPAVSGTLALMQEFFEQRLQRTNSPALMKALLINGARNVGDLYNFQVQNSINYQGWGLVKLVNSLPNGISNAFNWADTSPGAIKIMDQSPTNALATGQSVTRFISLDEAGRTLPLRVTLGWTDPPGNPVAGVKLVNDLDLVVTNLDNGDVYFGNDIPASSLVNFPWDTNAAPTIDSVNNIENIFLSQPLGSNYSITVSARRVNVNAVTAHTNDVVQDFALVISSGNGEATNALTMSNLVVTAFQQGAAIFVTNSIEQSDFSAAFLQNQRVGANPPLLPFLNSTNGMTNQWKYYVVTNTTSFTNAAFLVSQQTDLATPRVGVFASGTDESTRRYADIDLYVTVNNPALTNLDPAVVAASFQSRTRNDLSGDEFVIFTNAALNNIYYIGVKSEDQMAAQFDFFAIFSLLPLGAEDANGFVRGYPMTGYLIPDGSPSLPGGTRFVAITRPSLTGGNESIRRVVITNSVGHENYGDVISTVDHNSRLVVLDNHRALQTPPYPVPPGPYSFLYDDSGEGDNLNAIPPDGPGTFEDYMGEVPGGTWYFTYSDDALSQAGGVTNVMIRVDRQREDDNVSTNTVAPNGWRYFSRNIPVEATNFTVLISNITAGTPGPLELYIRKGGRPSRTFYDYTLTINPPGGVLSVDKFDLPPLTAGRYFIGVFNGNPTTQTFTYQSIVQLGLPPTPAQFGSGGSVPLLDDAVTNHTIFINNTNPISRLDVGLRIDHPRVSDLAVTLVSPRGTRVLLVENRGGTNADGFGSSISVTNFIPVAANGGPASTNIFVDTGSTVGTVTIDYNFYNVPDQMTVYYGSNLLADTTMTNGSGRLTLAYGPGASTFIEVRMNEFGNANTGTAWDFTASSINSANSYLVFTDNTNLTTTPIKFAAPPFSGTLGFTTNLSEFEAPVVVQDYAAPQIGNPDGWDVLTNTVTVISNTAYLGTNSLALRSGSIQRTLTTVAGQSYRLGYAFRKASMDGLVAWWELENNVNDRVGTNVGAPIGVPAFGAGKVGSAMIFDGFNDHVFIPGATSLDVGVGNGFTIETWINPAVIAGEQPLVEWNNGLQIQAHFWVSVPALGGGPGSLYANLVDTGNISHGISSPPGLLMANTYQHVAMTYDKLTGICRLYLNGVVVAQSNLGLFTPDTRPDLYFGYRPAGVSAGARFNGAMDEVGLFNRALSGGEIAAIFTAGAAGKCGMVIPPEVCGVPLGAQIYVPGQATNSFLGNSAWQLGGLIFTATNTNAVVNLTPVNPNAGSGVLLDSLTLTASGAPRYVLPEESLKAFEGENPFGTWTLEILDTRTGAINNVALVDWQLQFVFEDKKPLPGNLPPGVPQTNTVAAGGIVYFVVDVPAWAKFATNQLLFASGPLNVLFNQNTPPGIGATNVGDFSLFGPVTTGSSTLDTAGSPPLLPGQRYYLGVHNPGTSNVTFAVQVDYDITALTDAVSVTSTLAAGALPRYFSYDISTNATAVSFRLFGLNGNVDLVARRGAPLPTRADYDYGSFNPGLNNEDIVLLPASTPVPLTPGRWYLGVFNSDIVPVTYSIVATEFTNALPNIVTLTNGIPYTKTNAGGVNPVDYYRFVVSSGAVRAQFEINTPSDDVTLVARKGLPLPDLSLYDYISANVFTNDELIVLTTNSTPVLLSPGDWFISAVNVTGLPVSYSIKATEWFAPEVLPFVITSYNIISNEFCLTWNSVPGAYYFVQGKPDLSVTNWTTISPQITAVDYATSWCVPLPSPYQFFRVGEGLVLSSFVPPPRIQNLIVSPTNVVIQWNGPATARYNVQWSPQLVPPLWNNFTNVITSPTGLFQFVDDGTQTGGLGATRFYRLFLLP